MSHSGGLCPQKGPLGLIGVGFYRTDAIHVT